MDSLVKFKLRMRRVYVVKCRINALPARLRVIRLSVWFSDEVLKKAAEETAFKTKI